jgi:hypothetical protein
MGSPTTTTNTNAPWFTDTLRADYARGVAFAWTVYGVGVDDYVQRGWPVDNWLRLQFGAGPNKPGKDVILTLSLDKGMTFNSDEQRWLFERTLGWDVEKVANDMVAIANSDPAAKGHMPLPGFIKSDGSFSAVPVEMALAFMRKARRQDPSDIDSPPVIEGGARSCAVIIDAANLIVPDTTEDHLSPERAKLVRMLKRAPTDPELERAYSPLILLTDSLEKVNVTVRNAPGMHHVRVGLPTTEARLAFIRDMLAMYTKVKLEDGLAPEGLANITAGLRRRDIEDIMLRAGGLQGGTLTRQMALQRQEELMDALYGGVLRRIEPAFGYDALGGVDRQANYMRKRVIGPMRSGEAKQRRYVPMGVAFCGPPGTGKSAFAVASAHEAQVSLIELRPKKSKWYGESEGNLEQLIEGVEAFGDCFAYIDEFDKAFGSSEDGESHAVDAALRKRMQEWLADTSARGHRVLLVGTNYPDRIDPALFRTGRVDVKIPFLAPETAEERVDIVQRLLVRYGYADVALTADEYATIGEATEGWTGSDLEFAVVKAIGTVDIEGLDMANALADAVMTIVPAVRAEIKAQEQAAIKACNDLSLLPDKYRKQLADQQKVAAAEPQGTTESAVRGNAVVDI